MTKFGKVIHAGRGMFWGLVTVTPLRIAQTRRAVCR